MATYTVNIFASFNQNSLVDPQENYMGYGNVNNYLNTVPVNQTCTITHHSGNINALTITSNGIIDGNFNIFPIKYVNEPVNFVAQLVDSFGNEAKDYRLLTIDDFIWSVTSNNIPLTGVTFYSNFGTLSSLQQGGFFKGYFVSETTAASATITANFTGDNLNIDGVSNSFNIYQSGGLYQLRKVNENFDQTAAYLSLAVQPTLQENPNFFNAFLGQIVGDSNSDPNTLGIETFEKISNYVSNIEDIDYSNLNQLKSLLDSVNSTYQNFNYNYPPSLRRLTDMLSVKHKRLFGQTNQWQGNFNSNGFTNNVVYGANKGLELDFSTTILSAGSAIQPNYIVALERYGNVYTVVNTNLLNISADYITTSQTVSTYALSSVKDSWGWDLVLPQTTQTIDVSQYYTFYNFVPTVQGSLLQKFIDFNNPNNTLSITNSGYNDYVSTGGIMDEILLNNIYTSLEILS